MARFHITSPRGLESLLLQEMAGLGFADCAETVGGVSAEAELRAGYRACLWSRLANRVLLVLGEWPAPDADSIHRAVSQIDWDEHIAPDGTLAVDFSGSSGAIRDTRFGALKCKDAVVDWFTSRGQGRPSVDRKQPDVRLNARLYKGQLRLSIDLSGDSLHRRGYREQGALAPLKENLAAALLLRADWPGIAARGGHLIDPLCGSGTLLIEAAWMAMGIAPGLLRRRWGFDGWQGHIPATWRQVLEEARQQRAEALTRQWPEIRGYDAAAAAIRAAESNIRDALLEGRVRVIRKELAAFRKPTHADLDAGLVITNPPYGERLSDQASLVHLYRHLGDAFKRELNGWQAAVITGNPDLGKKMGLHSHRQYQFRNGTIPAKLLLFDLKEDRFIDRPASETGHSPSNAVLTSGATMLVNRLRKNLKKISKWIKKEDVSCYRVYDRDMPEYAVLIDIFGDHAHISEYRPPANIEPEKAQARLLEVLDAVTEVFGFPAKAIHLKQRERQKGQSQYTRRRGAAPATEIEVSEGPARFLLNLDDYLDTGLFIDHRAVRRFIGEQANGKRFLNLFCYTGTATVHAGLGGAHLSTSVDLSNTYLGWTRRNLALNGLSEARHRTEQGDCLQWLKDNDSTFDLILLDPPSFSNSKRFEGTLDISRDHPQLIEAAMQRLAKDGLLIFSCNRRGFKLDDSVSDDYQVADKTHWSLDPDVKGSHQPPHYCWFLRHPSAETELH